jgi:hypothetical protein
MKSASGEITRGRKPTVESVRQSVETVLKEEYMKDIFQYEILEKDSNIILNFYKSDKAFEQIRHDVLGKTALFTDRSDFSNEEIIGAYRGAWLVEGRLDK